MIIGYGFVYRYIRYFEPVFGVLEGRLLFLKEYTVVLSVLQFLHAYMLKCD